MATAKPYAAMPFPLGAVKPNHNVPLRITNNYTDLNAEGVASVWIQALASNTNTVYILCQNTATAKDLTGYSNVAFALTAGQGIPVNGKFGNAVILGYLWVDPAVDGEGVFCTIQEN